MAVPALPEEFRLLIYGSRDHPWPRTVRIALDHFYRLHGPNLVLIEGAARGADRTAHN